MSSVSTVIATAAIILLLVGGCVMRPTMLAEDAPARDPGCGSCRQAAKDEARGPSAPSAKAFDPADFESPLTPPLRSPAISLGPADAQITLLAYLDVSCPYSRDAWASIAELVNDNAPRVRAIVRHFALKPNSAAAHAYLEAAARVDNERALTLLQRMFQDPPGTMASLFGGRSADEIIAASVQSAHLSGDQLDKFMRRDGLHVLVAEDSEEARRLGFTGTPGILINGVRIHGAFPKGTFQSVISEWMNRLPAASAVP